MIKNHNIAYFVLLLVISVIGIDSVYADTLGGYEIMAGENGGSFLMIENKIINRHL